MPRTSMRSLRLLPSRSAGSSSAACKRVPCFDVLHPDHTTAGSSGGKRSKAPRTPGWRTKGADPRRGCDGPSSEPERLFRLVDPDVDRREDGVGNAGAVTLLSQREDRLV